MIIERFLGWLESASQTHRCEAAFALAKLWLEPEMEAEERDAAEAAMTLLLDDASFDVRRSLAEAFAGIETAPRHVIMALAGDESEIAAIVLSRSAVFLDGELVEIVKAGIPAQQSAIAARAAVSPVVCEAIAASGDEAACLAMLENPAARIEPSALHLIAARHGASTPMRHLLLQCEGLPPATRLLLIDKLGEALRLEMSDTPGLSQVRVAQLIADNADRTIIAYAAKADEHELPQIAAALIESGRMTTAFLLRAICMGNIALFANSLGQLCEIPVRRVEAAMGAGRRPAFRALYIKSGLPDCAFDVFANAVEAWRKVLADDGAADGARLTWLVTRDVLSAYRGNTDHAVDSLLVLLRRLAAEAARTNARSIAGRITSEMRERDQRLLEMHTADPMIAVMEAFPVIEVPEPVLMEFAVHFAEEIVDLEERIASGELELEAEAVGIWPVQPSEAGDAANDDFEPAPARDWGQHPLMIDLGDAQPRSRAA
jgi:uncharacterized protein (DUF2336 family)